MSDEQAIEQEIQAKGLTAPRITPADIDAQIVSEAYYVFPGTTLTVCLLTLQNGFHVTGESVAASPENFDEEIGRRIARTNAREKIWALEGYLLRSRLAAYSVHLLDEQGVIVGSFNTHADAEKFLSRIDKPTWTISG
jgi:hypothetical protein